jgi:hypothetical protein
VAVGITWNYRDDPDLPFYVGPLGTVAALPPAAAR